MNAKLLPWQQRVKRIKLALCTVLVCLPMVAVLAQDAAPPVNDVRARRAAQKADIDRVTAEYRAKIPQDAYIRGPDGQVVGVNPNHPEVKRLDAEWRTSLQKVKATHNVGDARFDELANLAKEAGLAEGGIKNSGSRPKSINSDMDMTEMSPGQGKKLAKTLSDKGYTVRELADRWVVAETDTTIWKKPANVDIGSPEHRAMARRAALADDAFPTKGGLFETTGGAQGVQDPEGAVLANAKKFSDACGTCDPATRLTDIDGHTIGKSVSKAAEWTGTKSDSEFFRQADALRNHQTWEEAGVCHPADPPEIKAQKVREFLNKAQEHLGQAAEAGATQSRALDDIRTRQAADADGVGDLQKSAKIRDAQIDSKISNQETMKRLAEVDPQLAARLNGTKLTPNPDGTFTNTATGETLTPSQAREMAANRSSQEVVKTTEQVIKANEAAAKPVEGAPKVGEGAVKPAEGAPKVGEGPVKPVEGEVAPEGKWSKTMKYGGLAVLVYGIYEGIKTGAERAVEEEKAGDSGWKTWGMAWGYSLWYGSGIGGAWDTGKDAGLASAEQFRKDLQAGKNPSEAWAKARAMLWGTGTFLKGMTIDPIINAGVAVKEGIGAVGDTIDAHRKAGSAAESEARTKAFKEGRHRGMKTTGMLEYDIMRIVATVHTVENLTELVRAMAGRAADPTLSSSEQEQEAARIFDQNFPVIRREWDQKRMELRREYIQKVGTLRGVPMVLTYSPNPAELPVNARPLDVELQAEFPGLNLDDTVSRMEELLELLAGSGTSVETTCQFKGGEPGPSTTTTLRVAKVGKYESSATLTFKCGGDGLTGENAVLNTTIVRTAKLAFDVVMAGASGSFAGTFSGGDASGTIRFTVSGSAVSGTVTSSVINASLQGTFDPATQTMKGTVSGTQAISWSDKVKATPTAFRAQITGTFNGKEFRGNYGAASGKYSDRGTWHAAGKMGTLPK